MSPSLLAEDHVGEHPHARHEETPADRKLERGIGDGVALEVREDPPEPARARQRREVAPRQIEERVALRSHVDTGVGVLLEAIRLALDKEASPELVADAERERVTRAGARGHRGGKACGVSAPGTRLRSGHHKSISPAELGPLKRLLRSAQRLGGGDSNGCACGDRDVDQLFRSLVAPDSQRADGLHCL